MLALLATLLPNLLLNGLHSYLQATTTVAVEGEQTRRQVALATISGVVAVRQAQGDVIKTGMAHKAFWIPWLIAAIPATVWYAWGMADSTWPGHFPHVAALPQQLLDLTNRVWDNLFLPGGITAAGTAIASAIKASKK
jgi:hypothetical protein